MIHAINSSYNKIIKILLTLFLLLGINSILISQVVEDEIKIAQKIGNNFVQKLNKDLILKNKIKSFFNDNSIKYLEGNFIVFIEKNKIGISNNVPTTLEKILLDTFKEIVEESTDIIEKQPILLSLRFEIELAEKNKFDKSYFIKEFFIDKIYTNAVFYPIIYNNSSFE